MAISGHLRKLARTLPRGLFAVKHQIVPVRISVGLLTCTETPPQAVGDLLRDDLATRVASEVRPSGRTLRWDAPYSPMPRSSTVSTCWPASQQWSLKASASR